MTVYSHSRLSSFEKCPKQFQYRYILKIPVETEGIEAFLGKRVHEVLERLYDFVHIQKLIPSLQKVIHRYHVLWDESYDEKRVRIVRKGTPASFYRDLGARCLETFYQRHHPFDQDETLGIEEHVEFDLDEAGDYRFQGYIDRVARARDGAIEIQDYKTGRYVPSQEELDDDRQLALYQLGIADRFPDDQPVRLVWHYLQKSQVRTSERTREQLAELREETIKLIDQIESATQYPSQRSRLCDWCEYKTPCFASES